MSGPYSFEPGPSSSCIRQRSPSSSRASWSYFHTELHQVILFHERAVRRRMSSPFSGEKTFVE
eukprot:2468662-Prymnesium_polylepis.1